MNEPAFPCKYGPETGFQGMTLRDYFAASLLAGMVAGDRSYNLEGVAREAYELADAMLKERDK
jgi:hypothetical protein